MKNQIKYIECRFFVWRSKVKLAWKFFFFYYSPCLHIGLVTPGEEKIRETTNQFGMALIAENNIMWNSL